MLQKGLKLPRLTVCNVTAASALIIVQMVRIPQSEDSLLEVKYIWIYHDTKEVCT